MTLREALAAAIREFTQYGFDRPERLDEWMRRLRAAARKGLPTRAAVEKRSSAALEQKFKRAISYTTITRHHPGVSRLTLSHITPRLRLELTRRIVASADLIKLNQDQAIQKTLQRFSGWATSIPTGGSRSVEKGEVKTEIAKSLRQIDYAERRVLIDQGHKLMSSIDAVIAQQTDAIAGMWRSHWRQPGYDYRPDHKERDKQIYAIRGSWAMEKGLMKKGAGYLDEMTQAAEEPFCRCYVVYLLNLRDLPADMLTEKGRDELKRFSIAAGSRRS